MAIIYEPFCAHLFAKTTDTNPQRIATGIHKKHVKQEIQHYPSLFVTLNLWQEEFFLAYLLHYPPLN